MQGSHTTIILKSNLSKNQAKIHASFTHHPYLPLHQRPSHHSNEWNQRRLRVRNKTNNRKVTSNKTLIKATDNDLMTSL